MQIINDVPSKEIFDFLCADYYDHEAVKDKWSATTLCKPTQQIVLQQRYDEKIEVKASSMFHRVFGSAVHLALEALKGDDIVKEKRFEAPILVASQVEIITGKMDLVRIADKELVDYKTGSVWKFIFNDFQDYFDQVNIYHLLLLMNKVAIDKAKIVFIMRDHRESEKAKFPKYPDLPMMDIPVALVAARETHDKVAEKIYEIRGQMALDDKKLTPCTDVERWKKKPGDPARRCASYCSAVKFCQQFKAEKK